MPGSAFPLLQMCRSSWSYFREWCLQWSSRVDKIFGKLFVKFYRGIALYVHHKHVNIPRVKYNFEIVLVKVSLDHLVHSAALMLSSYWNATCSAHIKVICPVWEPSSKTLKSQCLGQLSIFYSFWRNIPSLGYIPPQHHIQAGNILHYISKTPAKLAMSSHSGWQHKPPDM